MANPFDQMAAEEAARQPAEAPRDNPFTAMAQQERAERDSAMRVALDQALRVMPEQAANDNQVAKGLGLPVALVERNRDETTRMWKARELQAAVSASPVLERQLFDPQFAKLAHDDVGNLSTLEAALRLARDTGSALLSAGPTLAAGVWGGVRAVGDVLGPAGAPISASAGRQAAAADALAKGLMPKADSVWGAGWYSGVQSFGLNMLQMPLALLPGGQSALGASVAGMPARMTPLLASMGLVTGGGAYQQAREQGVSVPQALAFGASQGAIEAGTEALGMPALFSLLKPGKFGAKAVEYLLKEQGGEQLATLGQDLNEWAVLPENKAKTFADYLQERPSAALQTAIATAVGGGAQAATVKGVGWIANRAEYQAARAQQAEAHGQLIQQLNELASASKVLARSPEDFQQFVKEASADSPLQTVYVDGNVLHQSGLAEPLAQAAPELAADIQQAVETGGAVEIPVDQYLTRIAPTPLAQQLADHLRTEPDGYSRAEAQQFMATEGERLQADLERTIADAEQGDAFRASADAVRDSIKSQLDTANRFRPEVNDAYSRIVGAYFATRAAQLGTTPEELFKRYPLKIAAERIDGQQFDQGGMRVIYRGTNDSGERIKGGISEGALFAAADEATAKSYAGTDGTVEQIGVKPDAKILIEGSTEYAKVTGRRKGKLINTMRKGENLLTAANEVAEQARAAGYDAIEFTSMKDMGIAIFNEDKFVRGYSDGQQLNQAAFDPDHAASGKVLYQSGQAPDSVDAEAQRQFAETERAYGGRAAYDKAKAEGKTKLTYGQWVQVRTPNFKRWFGDWENDPANASKVVDSETGEPLVVYHGTNAEFTVFDQELADDSVGGFWFSDSKNYAYDMANGGWDTRGKSNPSGVVVDVYLRMSNPMRYDVVAEGEKLAAEIGVDRPTDADEAQALIAGDIGWDQIVADLVKDAKRAGHDGLVIENFQDGRAVASTAYIAFRPEQIKSAIGNRGTFDGTTGNILHQSAYHGSPYRFDKFSLDHMGKGEGAQAYGWGLYFAGNKAVAEYYREMLGGAARRLIDARFSEDPELWAAGQLFSGVPYATVREGLDILGYQGDADDLMVKAEDRLEKERAAGGQLYQVEIPEDDTMLLWDKPLSEQPEKVRAALENADVMDPSVFSQYTGEQFYEGMVRDSITFDNMVRSAAQERASKFLNSLGIAGIKYLDGTSRGDGDGSYNYVIFDDNAVEILNTFYQNQPGKAEARGSFNPSTLNIALLEKADLSTFLHESAHFFYENDIALAAQIAASQQQGASITAGEQQILADVGTLLTWHGLKGDVGAQLTEWYNLPFEQRRAHHERTAESFEAYLLEGKAPSIELAPYFQRFRSWLVRVYASLKDFLAGHPEAGTLTPEVRQVFDRMLATNDAIVQMEQARSMLPLFESAEQGGLSPEAWAQYQQDNAQQTQDAVQDLQARSLRDLQWARNARSRQLKRLQREANDLRKAAGVDAWREVMQQPVYRAWRFLTGKITEEDRIGEAPDASPQPSGRGLNPEVDSLLVAIAKLGGIARESAGRDLGVHADDQVLKGSVFGAPPFRKEGGLSADAMAERLLEAGYLLPDEHGKADLRELEELVAGELGGSPAYSVQWNMRSAMPEMQAGEQAVDPSQLGAGRLDKGSLGDMYGPSDARIAQLTGLRMTASKGALHPDIVAELFGFDSGDALVQALLEATPLREAVGAATDQIMLERHGELATPEALEQAADMAVHNEARGRAVATELAALTKATGKPKLLADAARQFAAEAIARLKVRELIPSRFSNAQAKAARNAKDAMKAGDLAKAGAEKRNELLQHYSARAAFDAREEVEKARKYLRKFDGEVKGLDPAYLSQITTLLGKYELRAHSLKDAERTVNLRAWVQSRLNDGEIPALSVDLLTPAERTAYFAEVASRDESGELVYQEDEDAIKLLADAIERSAKRSYKDLTVEEFRGLVDTVRNIEHLGRLKDTLLTARDRKSYEAVRNEMAAGIVAEAKTSGKNTPTATDWWGKKVQGIKGFLTSHIKAASWARVMDGGRDNGPVWRYLIQPANERATQETAEKAKATEDLSAILGPILKDASLLDKSGKGRYFPSIGRSLNLQGRLAVALNYGNESNLQRLLGGDGWTQEQIMPVLQSLTAKEWQAVQAVWDYLESYWPRIVAKELRVTGKAPERIPARAFTVRTADGQTLTLRGGYFLVVFDPRTNMKADADAKAQEAKEMQRAAYSSATTRRSFTKQRVEELHGRPLLLSLQGLYSGVNDVIHDLAWHEWVLDANKLLKSKTIDAAIREHYGPEVKHELEKWRDDVVMNQRRLGHATERFVGFARQNISAAALSFSVWSAIQQPLGLVNSGARIGWHWLGRGVADYIASPFATTREVMEKSAWMQNRTRTRFRELNELRNTVQGQTAAKELMGRYGYWMLVRMQLLVDIPTWRGAYAKAVAEGHDERTAVNLADQGVKDAQGGGEEVDQAGVERGSAYAKLFAVFYSYMGSTLNTAYTSAKTDKNKARAAANILLIVTVPTILQSLLRDALTPGDDDDDPEKLAKKLAGEQLSFLFGLLVGGREFSQTAKGLFGGTGGFSGYSGPAGLRMVSDVDRLATQAKQGEFDEAFVKASISVLGDLSGLPSVQINRTITGVKAMAEGKTDNPLALAFGFQKQ